MDGTDPVPSIVGHLGTKLELSSCIGARNRCQTRLRTKHEALDGWTAGEDVTIIMVMDRTLPLASVKAHLSEIVDQVEAEHDRVVLTRNCRAAAVIMSPDDLEALEETLDLLSSPGALQEIQVARKELEDGDYLSAAELRSRFLAK